MIGTSEPVTDAVAERDLARRIQARQAAEIQRLEIKVGMLEAELETVRMLLSRRERLLELLGRALDLRLMRPVRGLLHQLLPR